MRIVYQRIPVGVPAAELAPDSLEYLEWRGRSGLGHAPTGEIVFVVSGIMPAAELRRFYATNDCGEYPPLGPEGGVMVPLEYLDV